MGVSYNKSRRRYIAVVGNSRRGDREKKSFQLKRDADLWFAQEQSKRASEKDGSLMPYLSIDEALQSFLGTLGSRTRKYRRHLERDILILAKEEKLEVLDDISAKKLEHFLIADHGTSIYTTTKRVKHFKAFCKYVELQGWCRFDWLSRISASDKKASRKRALHQDEVQMLLKYLKANHLDVWYPIIFTMLNTGLRSKEIIFLEWDDIDLKGMTLRVRPKPHIVVNGEPVLCKSESSVRAVPLSSRALAVLKTLSSRSGYVFPSASGMHRANNFYRDFMVALKDAPLSRIKEVTPHVMRHTFISHLLVYGKQDLLTVSRLAGHASIETTQIYLHLIGGDEHRRGAVESLPDYEV